LGRDHVSVPAKNHPFADYDQRVRLALNPLFVLPMNWPPSPIGWA
jgi:hypothetical protein